MLLQEHIEKRKHNYQVQIFATDIDNLAIRNARAGIYPANIAADVSPERLSRFFTAREDGNSYQVQQFIRDMLIFSEQDVTLDPPFSRLGLVSCRNLLIYMGTELQKKVLSLFQYALKQDGFLFLGSAESIGELTDVFHTVDRKWKLYQHKGEASLPLVMKATARPLAREADSPALAIRRERRASVRESVEGALLRQYAPAGVVTNEHGEIIYIHGHTGHFLEPALGDASVNILRMAREGLKRELTAAIRRVAARKEPVSYQGLQVKANGGTITVDLTVRLFEEGPALPPGLMLVIFKDVSDIDSGGPKVMEATGPADDRDERIKALEQESQDKEEYLQATFQELETSNEELKSTNEEFQSANEELGSTNEELETSREELQSVNEELLTVNNELERKVDLLTQSGNYMNNLLSGTGVGTIFVDNQMCITFFTPVAAAVIRLIQGDIGQPVAHLTSNLVDYDRLEEDIRAVLGSLVPREVEVRSKEGLWYLMKILPFRTLENAIEGAVITLIDITRRKKAEEKTLQEANALKRLAIIVHDSSDAVTVQDLWGHTQAWNPSAVRMYGWSESEALGMNVRKRIPEGDAKKELAMLKELALGNIIEPFKTQRLAKDGKAVDVWLTASALIDEAGKMYAISTIERKIG
jgi:two-component system CheB/CheR fusion protein